MSERFRCNTDRYDAGFTLIELLITLALLSLLTLTLFASIRYGTRIWEASQTSAATAENVRAAQERIAYMIAAAYPKFTVAEDTPAHVEFEGAPATLRMLAPDPNVRGAFAYLTVHAEPAGITNALVLDREGELAPANAPKNASEVLLREIHSVQFFYFGAQERGGKLKWSDRWQEKTRPPLLVRVRVALADHRVAWPELTVSPQIEGDVSCTLDALTRYCGGR